MDANAGRISRAEFEPVYCRKNDSQQHLLHTFRDDDASTDTDQFPSCYILRFYRIIRYFGPRFTAAETEKSSSFLELCDV